MLFSEPKIPQCRLRGVRTRFRRVSVLFSEPKIPQSDRITTMFGYWSSFQCSSASRKFLNNRVLQRGGFCKKCFSALQRAENSSILRSLRWESLRTCFSALQRAENSSIIPPRRGRGSLHKFQCSSASRKFLNSAQMIS